ncbi:uncharacterized protein Fot_44497 [Forsythia ovata]|uniref:Uncharacterized protein n=1 Tax=Forsythia ovata TaxID=205694 RepID=A0ABD1R5K5_9LAMI
MKTLKVTLSLSLSQNGGVLKLFTVENYRLKFSAVMDFALWDPSDYQDENNYYIDDYWHCDFYSGCGHDAIEEDALNEKSCVQVLGILVKKADEEIMELEADAVILLSQLTWADKDWSDLCSATLREKIDHLDISVQSLKMEIAGDENFLGVELLKNKKPAERLHDIVKPLWDSCFPLIQKQTEIMIIQRSIPPADELRKLMYRSKHRKLKAKKDFALMKNNEFQDPPADPEVRRIKHPKAVTSSHTTKGTVKILTRRYSI